MSDSILNDVKKVCSLDPSYTVFDQDIILHINSGLATLRQLGVGSVVNPLMITSDAATWADLLGDDEARFADVKTWLSLKVRIIFDPPSTSYTIDAFNNVIQESEWRINVERERTEWVDPNLEPVVVIDGGSPDDTTDDVFDGGAP